MSAEFFNNVEITLEKINDNAVVEIDYTLKKQG